MQPPIRRNLLIYLTALSLFFAGCENALPHPLPFIRLGLANIPLLMALPLLGAREFALLAIAKWFSAALISGTLLSHFALMSLCSNIAGAIAMFLLYHIAAGFLSLYSVSAVSALLSSYIQLMTASLLLGISLSTIMPYMLLFSIFSGLVTAFIAYRITIPCIEETAEAIIKYGSREQLYLLPLFLLAILLTAVTESIQILLINLILALVLQRQMKRRIIPSIYIFTFLSVVLLYILTPSGMVIYGFITEGALKEGLCKALSLCITVSLSQSFSALPPASALYSRALSLSGQMLNVLSQSKGSLLFRIRCALSHYSLDNIHKSTNKVSLFTLICILSLIIVLTVLSLSF